jgi:hypothetical protein
MKTNVCLSVTLTVVQNRDFSLSFVNSDHLFDRRALISQCSISTCPKSRRIIGKTTHD